MKKPLLIIIAALVALSSYLIFNDLSSGRNTDVFIPVDTTSVIDPLNIVCSFENNMYSSYQDENIELSLIQDQENDIFITFNINEDGEAKLVSVDATKTPKETPVLPIEIEEDRYTFILADENILLNFVEIYRVYPDLGIATIARSSKIGEVPTVSTMLGTCR